jgi:hypothetical protein
LHKHEGAPSQAREGLNDVKALTSEEALVEALKARMDEEQAKAKAQYLIAEGYDVMGTGLFGEQVCQVQADAGHIFLECLRWKSR